MKTPLSSKNMDQNCLHSLPPQVLRRVLEHLPLSSMAAFAMTSHHSNTLVRSIKNPFALIKKEGNEAERARFSILCFDKHYPDHIICYHCGSYHKRKSPGSRDIWGQNAPAAFKYGTRTICKRRTTKFDGLDWETVHETMRGFRHSPRYGHNLLRPEGVHQQGSKRWGSDIYALPCDGHLLLRKRWVSGIPEVEDVDPKAVVFGIPYSLCPHLNSVLNIYSMGCGIRNAVSRFYTYHDPEELKYGYVDKALRCTACPTEVVIEITPRRLFIGNCADESRFPKSTYVVSVSRYVDFGKCQDPEDIEWKALTERRPGFWRRLFSRRDSGSLDGETARPTVDLTHLEPVCERFNARLHAPLLSSPSLSSPTDLRLAMRDSTDAQPPPYAE